MSEKDPTNLEQSETIDPPAPVRRRGLGSFFKNPLVIIVLVLILGGGGYFGYRYWQDQQSKIYIAESWGTILSHMAFSNHFLFHHLYKHGSPNEYAQAYMAILSALEPGGSFYYAPGLPFIEQFLPARFFHVGKRGLDPLRLPQTAAMDRLHQDTGYAARVTKKV
jgi:hypothetical protein